MADMFFVEGFWQHRLCEQLHFAASAIFPPSVMTPNCIAKKLEQLQLAGSKKTKYDEMSDTFVAIKLELLVVAL